MRLDVMKEKEVKGKGEGIDEESKRKNNYQGKKIRVEEEKKKA